MCIHLFGITIHPILISKPQTCPAKEVGKKPLAAGIAQTTARGRAEIGLEASDPEPRVDKVVYSLVLNGNHIL